MMMCVYVFAVMNGFFCIQIYRAIRENKRVDEQNRLLREQCQSITPKITHIRKMRHDIANHLYVIEELVKREETEEYYCNDIVVDSAIRSKIVYGEQEGISISHNIGKIPMERIERIELISLISNILDNAIEACQSIQNQEGRWIIFSMKEEKTKVSIECANSKNPEIQLRQGEKTTKRDKKSHGIGKEIIKDVVNKYGGTIKVTEEPESYSLLIKGLLL